MELVGQATTWVMKLVDVDALQMRASGCIRRADSGHHGAYIEAYPHLNGMATTWTSAYIVSSRAVVSHVGDSRLSVPRRGCSAAHPRRHAGATTYRRRDSGRRRAAFKHVLTDSFGGASEKVNIKIYPCELQAGDRLLLCTDGLYDMVDDAQLAQILAELRKLRRPVTRCWPARWMQVERTTSR